MSSGCSFQGGWLVRDVTIDQVLRHRAAQTPNAIAIAAIRGKPLTYRGLVDQMDYVARFLAKNGLTTKAVSPLSYQTGRDGNCFSWGLRYRDQRSIES